MAQGCVRSISALGAMLAFVASASVSLAAPSGCLMVKVAELPVKFERNRPLVPVSINGKPGWFLIDTGAGKSMMFGGAATEYGLGQSTASHATFLGVGGAQDANFVNVAEFGLSDVKVKNLRLYAIGHRGTAQEAGLLGRDFLSKFDLEFDLANKMLRLWQPQNCGQRNLAYWTKDPQTSELSQYEDGAEYEVKILVNGKAINAILDSGATTSVVTADTAASAQVKQQDYASDSSISAGIGEKAVPTRTATFDEVVIGDEQVKHAKLRIADLFVDDKASATGSMLQHSIDAHLPPMLLGADFLRSHRVLLAAKQHRLYFTYSGGPIFQVVGDAVQPQLAADETSVPPAPTLAPGK